MNFQKLCIAQHARRKAMVMSSALSLIAGPYTRSQENPVPPIPHAQAVLPGTHVPPQAVVQRAGVDLHIDALTSLDKPRCAKGTFEIKYTVANNTPDTINGIVRVLSNDALLAGVTSKKLDSLLPKKTVSGAFTACCPSGGSFKVSMDYYAEARLANGTIQGSANKAHDDIVIACK